MYCTCKNIKNLEFPGGPVVRTCSFHCLAPGSISGQGTKIPQAARCGQKKKKKKIKNSRGLKRQIPQEV